VDELLMQTISSFTHCRWTPRNVSPNMGFVLKSIQIM